MKEADPHYRQSPGYREFKPGISLVEPYPEPSELFKPARKYFEVHLLNEARQKGKDLVAFSQSHWKEILVGVGLGTIVGGVIIYQNEHKKK